MKTKITFLILAAALIADASRADGSFGYGGKKRFQGSSNFVQGQSGKGDGPRGFNGRGGHGPKMSDTQRQAVDACLAQNGITPPARPQLTAEQQTAMQSCQASASDRESFRTCMDSAGIAPPPRPPEPSAEQRQVFESCLQSVRQSGV
jgi:hypothetical protein